VCARTRKYGVVKYLHTLVRRHDTCSVTWALSGPVLKNVGKSQSIQISDHDQYVPEIVLGHGGQRPHHGPATRIGGCCCCCSCARCCCCWLLLLLLLLAWP
jgi:hypothetical protein